MILDFLHNLHPLYLHNLHISLILKATPEAVTLSIFVSKMLKTMAHQQSQNLGLDDLTLVFSHFTL